MNFFCINHKNNLNCNIACTVLLGNTVVQCSALLPHSLICGVCMFSPCLCNWDTPSCLSIIRFSVVLSQGTNQHDVQELNRILFSALEHSLVDTTGSTFIHRLYHGTIVNSIVCKECGNVSQRQVCECLQGFSASLTLWLSACLLNTGGNTFFVFGSVRFNN